MVIRYIGFHFAFLYGKNVYAFVCICFTSLPYLTHHLRSSSVQHCSQAMVTNP